ncbi:HrgC protein [Helicobacter pylori]|nr:HrgC protein [Helicobacter pylori]
MATIISLKKDNLIKKGLVGFSWTTLFFGFFVPVIRGDARWVVIMLIPSFCWWPFLVTSHVHVRNINELIFLVSLIGLSTFICNIIFAFIYNKQYTTRLLESGYEPADEYSRGILRSKGMIA